MQRTISSRSSRATSEKRTSSWIEVSAPVDTVEGANLSSLYRSQSRGFTQIQGCNSKQIPRLQVPDFKKMLRLILSEEVLNVDDERLVRDDIGVEGVLRT